MKPNSVFIPLVALLLTVCSCSTLEKDFLNATPLDQTEPLPNARELLDAPPIAWTEHWFDHVQNLTRVYYDDTIAVYYDKDVKTSIDWPQTYLAKVWKYTVNKYGTFGSADPRLYAIFHSAKYSGGHPSVYLEGSHDWRNVIDCGSTDPNAWVSGTGNDLDLTTHEVGHIVEGGSKNTLGSPAFPIWHDSKWAEIYIYDVYLGLGMNSDAQRWNNLVSGSSDSFPRSNTRWFRDWWYPIYTQFGNAASLNNFFTLLRDNIVKDKVDSGKGLVDHYPKTLNFGEFVHFWSGAAGTDLSILGLNVFGNKDDGGADWTAQFAKAKTDYPKVTYAVDITAGASITVLRENYGGVNSNEGSPKIIDGNYSTKYFIFSFSTLIWIEITLPSAQRITKYTITSANDAPDRDPKGWRVLASNDNKNYVDLDEQENILFENRGQTKVFSLKNNHDTQVAYKWYRLIIVTNNGSPDFQIAEWRLLQ